MKRRKRSTDFVPTVTRAGTPCKTCVRLGHTCREHSVKKKKAAKSGSWETLYLDALSRGHTKDSAAALAGVVRRTPFKRAQADEEFAALDDIAFNRGTARMLEIAFDRITDPKNPGDSILRHLLSVRGLVATKAHEVTGPDGGPIEHAHAHAHSMVPFDQLSPRLKREILREMRALEELDVVPWVEGKAIPVQASKVE